MHSFILLISALIVSLSSSLSLPYSSSETTSNNKRRMFIVADYGDASWDLQKNWKCCIEVFTLSGIGSELQFSEISTNGLCKRPKSGLFYVDVPSNSESIRCFLYYTETNTLFAKSVVFPAFDKGIFYLRLSGTGSISSTETHWSPFPFNAEQLAFLFLRNVDSALPSYINGYFEYETINESIVQNMSDTERSSLKWDSISWIDIYTGKEVTLSSKYAEIKKACESEKKETSQKKLFPYFAVFFFLLPLVVCLTSFLLGRRKKKTSSD